MQAPSHGNSYWNITSPASRFPSLTSDLQVDVAVVGAGIVGTTTARLLKDQGYTVALIEAHQAGRQATGKSTAKVTAQHSLAYQQIEQKFGMSYAQLYASAQQGGIELAGTRPIEPGIALVTVLALLWMAQCCTGPPRSRSSKTTTDNPDYGR